MIIGVILYLIFCFFLSYRHNKSVHEGVYTEHDRMENVMDSLFLGWATPMILLFVFIENKFGGNDKANW